MKTKYQLVEEYILQAIERGLYFAGDKLPSIRELSLRLSVGKNTVVRAYEELEASQIIIAHQRSGYRVANKNSMLVKPEAIKPCDIDLLSLSKEVLQQPNQQQLLPMGSAHPNIDFPAIRTLYAEIGRHSRQQSNIPSSYLLPPGDGSLIKYIANITQDFGIPISADEILITNGAQQAISLSLQALTKPGDIVLVDSPCYFGTLLLLESLDLKVIEISCSHNGMDIRAVEQAVKKWNIKAILVNPTHNNPTGYTQPELARKALLKATSGIPFIEDDVFGGLTYGAIQKSFKELDTENRVIYCSSLSKTLDSRLRIGWLLAGKYQEQIEKRLLSENMGSVNFIQSAVSDFLKKGQYKQHIRKAQRNYKANQNYIYFQLTKALERYEHLIGQYHLSKPHGGFLCWLTLPIGTNGTDIYKEALQKKISILPGEIFCTSNQYKHCVRLSFASYKNNEHWNKNIQVLARIIAKHCTKNV
ncbi:PLP-dependent aminotransferase family protein [Aliivibrio fischeri]|uniref:aminotransferase-like domain-containing protein n=1 Tax=Aliivibrio fischeri TaxID=668 RepID=UPI0012D9C452|nr:PLP-dependent aminotransferase family protein [Aliivibrio fischeri]MUI54655.1 GntR family transcriptional regulator [Aliivibrio fischeri]